MRKPPVATSAGAALLAAAAWAAIAVVASSAPAAKTPKPPKWKSSEVVTSAPGCTPEDGCGARVRSQWKAATKIPFGASAVAPDFPADAVFTLTFGDAVWAAPLSADPSYSSGARRATLTLPPASATGARSVTAKLRWNASKLSVKVAGPTPVTLVGFVDDPGTADVALRFPVRGCAQLGDVRADYAILVTGARSGRRVGGAGEDEGYVLPSASLRARGVADAGKGPPQIVSNASTDAAAGGPNTDPYVDLTGTVTDGGSVTRMTYQVDGGAEVDVALAGATPFPCGGVSVEFAATATLVGAGTHTILLRAYDDDGETGTASHSVRLSVPDLGPRVARMVPLGVRVPGLGNDDAGIGLIDETGRLWVQDSRTALEDGDHFPKLLATASPTGLAGVRDVADMQYADEKSPSRHNHWIAVHDDDSVSIDGDPVAGLPAIAQVSARPGFAGFSDFTLALTTGGAVLARGTNREGQLGDGSAATYRDAFAPVPGLSGVRRVLATGTTCFALTDAGELYVWGEGADRLRGDFAFDERVPGVVPAASPIVDFAPGLTHLGIVYDLFTVHADGTVFARSTQKSMSYLGNGAASTTAVGAFLPATQVTALAGIRSIVRERGYNGGAHCLTIRDSDGALFGWGINSGTEIGTGDAQPVLSPVLIDTGGARIAEVQITLSAVTARTHDGRVLGWGASSFQNPRLPAEVPGIEGAVQIQCEWTHAYALSGAGTVFTWRTFDAEFQPRAIVLGD